MELMSFSKRCLVGLDCLPLSCTTILVTLTAVSVVICLGPNRLPSNPFFLNSEVRSYEGQ